MTITHPQLATDFIARDRLLTQSLRPHPLPFSIAEEYPLVLDPNASHWSFVSHVADEVVAHANFWPRRVLYRNQEFCRVALIGNVATSEQHRGRGYMRSMFTELEKLAQDQQLSAMILWSDLDKFYQSLGFESLGQEKRCFFSTEFCYQPSRGLTDFIAIDPKSLKAEDLQALLTIRQKVPYTLERSPEEFFSLLQIPACVLFMGFSNNALTSYAIVGKGYDLAGVVHEWGASSPAELFDGVRDICQLLKYEQLIVLSPASLTPEWDDAFNANAAQVDPVSMALGKIITPDKRIIGGLQQLFVWGMDSI